MIFTRSNDRGFALAELLISMVVTGISVLMVIGAIASMIEVNKHVVSTTDAVNSAGRVESMFRDDISGATELVLDNLAGAPGFTIVASDLPGGGCRTSVWKFAPAADTQVVRDLTVDLKVSTATAKKSDGSVYCSGEIVSSESTTLATNIFNPAISYVNLAGRAGTVTAAGTAPVLSSLNAETKPATVSDARWGSTSIGGVQLSFSIAPIGDYKRDLVKDVTILETLDSISTPSQYLSTDFVFHGRTTLG